MAIKHAYTSSVSDSGKTELVQPSNWNAAHVITDFGASIIVASSIASDAAKAAALASGGSVCDGTADDVEIQAAIDALPTVGGIKSGHVHLSEGIFDIKASITSSENYLSLLLTGEGWSSTRLLWNSGVLGDYILDMETPAGGIRRITYENFSVLGGGLGTETGLGIKMSRPSLTESAHHFMRNIRVSYCADPALYAYYVELEMSACLVNSNIGRGLALSNAGHVHSFSTTFDTVSVDEGNFKMYGGTMAHLDIIGDGNYGAVVDGVFFEPVPTGYVSNIKLGSTNTTRSSSIINCTFNLTQTQLQVGGYYIDVNKVIGAYIGGNKYRLTTESDLPTTYINISNQATNTVIDASDEMTKSLIVDAGVLTLIRRNGEPDPQYRNWTNLLSNSSFEVGDPPTNWIGEGAGSTFARSTTQIKHGSYSAALTRVDTNCAFYYDIPDSAKYASRAVSLGCWVWASVASRARMEIRMYGGTTAYAFSSYHTGSSTWEWLTATATCQAALTLIRIRGNVITGNTTAYFDGIMAVEGNKCTAYSPKPDEFTICPHTAAYNISRYETGNVLHTNLGASGAVTITLPQTVSAGFTCRFAVMAAQELRIDPGAAGAIYINGAKQSDDAYITADDEAESVILTADGNGDWIASSVVGTWGVEV